MAEQNSQPVQRMSHRDNVTGVDAVDGSDGIDGMHTLNVEGVESAARGVGRDLMWMIMHYSLRSITGEGRGHSTAVK